MTNFYSSAFRFSMAILTIVLCQTAKRADAFVTTSGKTMAKPPTAPFTTTAVSAAGMGMGMGSSSKSKNGKKKNGKTSNGFTSTSSNNNNKKKSAVFDVSASLSRLEKKYDELVLASAKSLHNEDEADEPTAEMVVTVRAAPNKSKSAATADWVPVAQLCLRPHTEVSSEWAQAAVSLHCRELSHAASLSAKVFANVPRNDLQYAIEPTESFHKFVYDHIVLETKQSNAAKNNNDDPNNHLDAMTKAQARQVLELDGQEDEKSAIKKAYRTKSFQLHPDRLRDHSEEQVEQASLEYARVQKAYERLTSGVRTAGSSWYASLGGKDRNDFRPVELMRQDEASAILQRYRVESAVVGLDPALAQTFVTRNQAAGSSTLNGASKTPSVAL